MNDLTGGIHLSVLVVIIIRMPQVQKITPNIYLINLLRGDWQ